MSEAREGKPGAAELHRAAPLLAVLLLLLAGWFGWSGYAQWRADAVAEQVRQLRDHSADGVAQGLSAQIGRAHV